MARTYDIELGTELDTFVEGLLASGRYESTNDVIEAALRLLENHELQIEALRIELQKGVDSGISERTFDEIIADAKSRVVYKLTNEAD